MPIVCQHGLFIGVDRHEKLPKGRWLARASGDANLLCDYFRRASPSGDWRAVTNGKGKTPPRRIDILIALDDFAKSVSVGECGVFFFSGHACVTPCGLVLKSFDACDRFLADTSLPLARVLQALRSAGQDPKRFLVILDCCRNGLHTATTDSVPPNVCILYACCQGKAAFETPAGGILTRSIIESLEAISAETGGINSSVRMLCSRLGREVFPWRPPAALRYELCGSCADLLYLPTTMHGGTVVNGQRLGPSSTLKYCFGKRSDFERSFMRLVAAVFDWYGIPYDNIAGRNFVKGHFEFFGLMPLADAMQQGDLAKEPVNIPETPNGTLAGNAAPELQNYFFQVRLPEGCSRWASSDFLVHLLATGIDVPQSLVMTWPREIDFAVLKEFRHSIGGRWIGGGAGLGQTLVWDNDKGSCQGVASVSLESARTSVVISCETVDLYEMSLAYLLPRLKDVYDLFRSVTA